MTCKQYCVGAMALLSRSGKRNSVTHSFFYFSPFFSVLSSQHPSFLFPPPLLSCLSPLIQTWSIRSSDFLCNCHRTKGERCKWKEMYWGPFPVPQKGRRHFLLLTRSDTSNSAWWARGNYQHGGERRLLIFFFPPCKFCALTIGFKR